MKQPAEDPKPYKSKSSELYDMIYYETLRESADTMTAGQAAKLKGAKR
jgi:hypothetical protein